MSVVVKKRLLKSDFNAVVAEEMLAFTELDYTRAQGTTIMSDEMYDEISSVGTGCEVRIFQVTYLKKLILCARNVCIVLCVRRREILHGAQNLMRRFSRIQKEHLHIVLSANYMRTHLFSIFPSIIVCQV